MGNISATSLSFHVDPADDDVAPSINVEAVPISENQPSSPASSANPSKRFVSGSSAAAGAGLVSPAVPVEVVGELVDGVVVVVVIGWLWWWCLVAAGIWWL